MHLLSQKAILVCFDIHIHIYPLAFHVLTHPSVSLGNAFASFVNIITTSGFGILMEPLAPNHRVHTSL